MVAYAVISGTGPPNGTLIVEAQSSSPYYTAPRGLNVTVEVGSQQGTTPLTLTLSQGTYTINFPPMKWYVPPPARSLNVTKGKTSYAVGTYRPILDVVSVNQSMFNSSRITALHEVTPIVFVNPTSTDVVIYSSLTGTRVISTMQNFTYLFQRSGTYTFTLPLTTSPNLVVSVT